MKQTPSSMDVLSLISVFRLYPGFEMSFEHNSVRKNIFLSACFFWDSGRSSREMDQKFQVGGLIGYGNSCLESVFCYSKVFRLHALLHDAAGVMPTHGGKGPGYCYMIGRGPNSCLLGYVTWLLFCVYVKLFLSSILNSVDFWSSMALIVLDIELTEKKRIEELGLFIDGSLQGFSYCPPKTFKPKKQTTWNTSHLHGIAWSSGKLEYDKLFAVFCDIKLMKTEVFAKSLGKCRLLTNLLGQNVENLDDYRCPKIQDLVKTDNLWICSSYLFRHKTRLHCAERKAKMFRERAMQQLQFLYVFFVFVFTTKLFFQLDVNFFHSISFEILSLRNKWLNQKTKVIWIKLSLTTTIKRGNLGPVWDKIVPDRWLCFYPYFLSFCWSTLDAFGEFIFQKLVTNKLFRLEICIVRQVTFYPHQEYEQWIFYKISSLFFNGWSFRNCKIVADLQLARNWNISTKVWQNSLLLSSFPTSLQCHAKWKEKYRVCAGSKLWIYWFGKKQRYKVLVTIWRFLWRHLQFKNFCWRCHCWETSGSEHYLH